MNEAELLAFEYLDAIYRSLCAMLYNYAPLSGHPGGSISSGRFVSALLFDAMDYDISDPSREDADSIIYAAGHKALGLYAMWALRNEIVRIARPELLPSIDKQLRFEDLLGFRRNPTNATPLFEKFGSRALDGHPTPATPFVRVATGASGVGVGSALGYALAALDFYGDNAPRVHVVEGEGGLTPGRVAEALAFAGTASLRNAIMHIDWNQSSIDSDRVTREGDQRGDYVQWDPMSLFDLHGWNVIYVPDGTDFELIVSAQRDALASDEPTAIVYRTTKGWQYGIEGRASHGSGHKLCSPAFYEALASDARVPTCDDSRCANGSNAAVLEQCFWDGLLSIREKLERHFPTVKLLADRIADSQMRLDALRRTPRDGAPSVDDVYALTQVTSAPPELALAPGTDVALRTQLGRVLGYLNRFSGGALFIAAADLLGSTSIAEAGKDFDAGFFGAQNRDSRTLSIGGICEDAMSAVLSGVSAFGHHIGAGSSYGAFLAPLGHIAARLHAIGDQARASNSPSPAAAGEGARRADEGGHPMILICGHAGLKTGEDGPTHADPQPLQLLQENFPLGSMITLTPWEPNEIWPLMSAALAKRPSVIAPFVTRPNEKVVNRAALKLAPAEAAVTGVYKLRAGSDVTVVLQESGVAYAFITGALPRLLDAGIDVEVFYVASAELFDLLPLEQQNAIFPPETGLRAIGITGFTLPTMYRWITSARGRVMTMHPFMHGRYPGSGPGRAVIAEAGLDGESQFRRVAEFAGVKSY